MDRNESRLCGQAAVRAACAGESGVMVSLIREGGTTYTVNTGLAPLERVAFVERLFPAAWRNQQGNDILPQFQDYALPLIGAIAPYEHLSPIRPEVPPG